MGKLNDGAYAMETQEYGMNMTLMEVSEWEMDDRIWMQKNMGFSNLDLQKNQKTNHYKVGAA